MTVTYSIDKKAALSATTSVSNAFIAEYAKRAPADFIRVYLFALMQLQNRAFENDDIATSLELPDERIAEAFDYWQRMGLLTIVRADPLHIEFSRGKTPLLYNRDGKYKNLLDNLRPILGERVFSATELSKVYDWIEIFGFEEGAVLELVRFCTNTKGRGVSFRYMDETAKGWADANIITQKDAEEYTRKKSIYVTGAREVLRLLGMKRSPTEAEIALFKKWMEEYRFDADVIFAACAQTVGASTPSFGYLSKIVDTLYEKGAVDMETLERARKERMIFEDFSKELFRRAGLVKNPTADQKERIEMWLNEFRLPKDVLNLAADFAKRETRPFSFMCRAALRLHDADALNIEDARNVLSGMEKQPKAQSPGGYIKHNYTADDLAHIGINFDDEEDKK